MCFTNGFGPVSTGAGMSEQDTVRSPEWGTFGLVLICYSAWLGVVFGLAQVSLVLAVLAGGVVAALHSSLTHEALHGHPFQTKWINEALMALPLTLCIPYNRFRDLHLAHHLDSNLTDPYDDPETNFQDPVVWASMPRWKRRLYRANNTLLGRMVLGPLIGQVIFTCDEGLAALRGDRDVLLAWALHLPGVAVVIWVVAQSAMPIWAFCLSAYLGLAVLKIRTFLEHRAHEKSRCRTVIIEDRGPLAFLFLNNNFHVVHHMHPKAAWYQLPGLYRAGKARYLECNESYVYRSYADVFRQYFLKAKDPIPHPLWPRS